MTTKISKILVVFVTACSLAFMGFTLAMSNSGPDWRTEAEQFDDYVFSYTPGQTPSWSVRHRKETAALKTSINLSTLIAAAYQDATNRHQQAIQAIENQQPAALRARTKQYGDAIAVDVKGLDLRSQQLDKMYIAASQQIDTVANAGDAQAKRAVDIRNLAARSRESVFRLTREREQIETEKFRLEEQKRLLLDLLYQMRGIRLRLENREQQLIEQGGTIDVDPAASST